MPNIVLMALVLDMGNMFIKAGEQRNSLAKVFASLSNTLYSLSVNPHLVNCVASKSVKMLEYYMPQSMRQSPSYSA